MKVASIQRDPRVVVPSGTCVDASVDHGTREHGKGFGVGVKLNVHRPGMDQATAERLVAAADEVCPYSNGTRGNIPKSLSVIV